MTVHNDEPTLLDQLDRSSLTAEVTDAIARCEPPQVFGVHGDWGLGKTSFLHQVQWQLTGDCPQQPAEVRRELAGRRANGMGDKTKSYKRTIRAVWFDAWRYQHEDAPVVALLHEMRAQLSWARQVTKAVSQGAQVAIRGALLSIEELTKKIGIQYSAFSAASRESQVSNLATTLPSHTLREHLSKAIGTLLPKSATGAPQPRLAVFIDDLDRCEPEAAYRLMEGLKIYLTLSNCVFILGMNQKAVEGAICNRLDSVQSGPVTIETTAEPEATRRVTRQVQLQMERQTKSRAAAYMEKLCQNVWRLPTVRNPGRLLQFLLERTIESETVREWVAHAIEGYDCLPPNPRKLKGFANLIGRFSSRLPREDQLPTAAAIIETRLLLIVAYVYQFHHEVFVRWESDLSLFDRIRDRCRGHESDIPCLAALVLRKKRSGDERTPTPTTEKESTYPDPTDPNVFWIQLLVDGLGTEVTAEQFGPYLHGGTP